MLAPQLTETIATITALAAVVPPTVAEALVRYLASAGFRHVFGIPGGPLMPLHHALARLGLLEHILIADEHAAPFFAYGYWCAARTPAAIFVTSGGATKKLADGLGCAYADFVPMLALSAQTSTKTWGRHGSQDSSPWASDTVASLRSDTALSVLLSDPQAVADGLPRLLAHMRARNRPTHGSLAPEVSSAPAPELVAPVPHVPARPIDRAAVKQAARLLCATKRRALLVGSGCLLSGAADVLVKLIERLALPTANTPRAASAYEGPFSLGVFGFAGSPLAEAVLLSDDVEVILTIGTMLGELSSNGYDPRLRRKRIIMVDIEATNIGRTMPVELGVVGDARAFIEELLEELDRLDAEPGAAVAPPFVGWPSRFIEPAALDDRSSPIKPPFVMGVLRRVLPADALVFGDVGNSMAWLIHYLPRSVPGTLVTNLGLASMGHALPSVIGAKVAAPERAAVAVLGDAAWRMSGAELFTATEHGVAPVVICLNSGGHAMVEVGARAHFGGQIPPVRFRQPLLVAEQAASMGAHAVRVDAADDVEPAIVAALGAGRAALVEIIVDPDAIPPMGARLRTLAAALLHEGVRE